MKCPFCGADINIHDGGQSFYDDNELMDWQTDVKSIANTRMPDMDFNDMPPDNTNNFAVEEKKSKHVSRRKKKKNKSVNYPSLSNANVLIILCILSALVVVLLCSLILTIPKSLNGEGDNQIVSPTEGTTKAEDLTGSNGDPKTDDSSNNKPLINDESEEVTSENATEKATDFDEEDATEKTTAPVSYDGRKPTDRNNT